VSIFLKESKGRRISVIIPTYNRAQMVTRAIDSALRAVSPRDEIIVIDDGSTDRTEFVLEKFAGKIRYIKTVNRGAGPARNLGVQLARHDWIAFLDSDDEWMDDHLRLHRAFLEKADVLFSFSNFDVHYDDWPERERARMRLVTWTRDYRSWDEILGKGIPYSRYAHLPSGRPEFTVHTGNLYHLMLRSSYVPAWTSVVRRDVAGSRLHFPEDLPTFEDYDCYIRLSKLGTAAYLDCATAINHGHKGPRLQAIDRVKKARARIAILERNWGKDKEYLLGHREAYASVLNEMKQYEIKHLVFQGATKTARAHIKEVTGVPFSIRLLSRFPGGLAKLISSRYLAVKAALKRIRPGSFMNLGRWSQRRQRLGGGKSRPAEHLRGVRF
jgi:glycosyltransferase involved in cell wall biosynthesis